MPDQSTLAIEASGLVKSFGDVKAVDGVDLAVGRGSVYGVLGPNGAGKTTTIRMLATLLRPDSGSARVLGHDIARRGRRGPRPRQPHRPARLGRRGPHRAREPDPDRPPARPLARRRQGARRPSCSRRSASPTQPTRLVKNYSGGMRRRLDVAASIVVTPELMFLDEPTTGLDPRSRNQVWDIIRALVAGGTTILLCTQYLDEADQLADGIAVIDHGKVIAEGTPGQLKASVGSGALTVRLLDPEQRPEAERVLRARARLRSHLEADPAALSAPCADADRAAEAVAQLPARGRGDRRLLGRPAEPRRGLPGTHGPHRRGHADEQSPIEEEQAA